MDRISGLPDELICHALSFLSTKEAASTSLLSKRWRNLFAFSPNLRFEHEDRDEDEDRDEEEEDSEVVIWGRFSGFVNRVMAVSGRNAVKQFSLKYPHEVVSTRINIWIDDLLSRGGLEHLELEIANGVTSLPLTLFACKTLVTLKLGKWVDICMVPESPSLPALKTLFLDRVRFLNDGARQFEALISACRVLEDLLIRGDRLEHWSWCRIVSCTTLVRLTIHFRQRYSIDPEVAAGSGFRSITFDTPSLAFLDYAGYVLDEYPIVNLDSLVEAKLHLCLRTRHPHKSNPTNLIKALGSVEILDLSSFSTSEVFASFCEAIPSFESLHSLSIAIDSGYWKYLDLLLTKAPNLETLIIMGPWFNSCVNGLYESLPEYPFLFSCPVKVLKIFRSFWGNAASFAQIRQLMENLQCLEVIELYIPARTSDDYAMFGEIIMDLETHPTSCNSLFQFFDRFPKLERSSSSYFSREMEKWIKCYQGPL